MPIYNKLVRDRIPEIIEKDGKVPVTRILADEEYHAELLKKIVEEANEVAATGGDKKELVKEIGDVLEVIEAIVKANGLDDAEIGAVKKGRRDSRGAFNDKIFLESSD